MKKSLFWGGNTTFVIVLLHILLCLFVTFYATQRNSVGTKFHKTKYCTEIHIRCLAVVESKLGWLNGTDIEGGQHEVKWDTCTKSHFGPEIGYDYTVVNINCIPFQQY